MVPICPSSLSSKCNMPKLQVQAAAAAANRLSCCLIRLLFALICWPCNCCFCSCRCNVILDFFAWLTNQQSPHFSYSDIAIVVATVISCCQHTPNCVDVPPNCCCAQVSKSVAYLNLHLVHATKMGS